MIDCIEVQKIDIEWHSLTTRCKSISIWNAIPLIRSDSDHVHPSKNKEQNRGSKNPPVISKSHAKKAKKGSALKTEGKSALKSGFISKKVVSWRGVVLTAAVVQEEERIEVWFCTLVLR